MHAQTKNSVRMIFANSDLSGDRTSRFNVGLSNTSLQSPKSGSYWECRRGPETPAQGHVTIRIRCPNGGLLARYVIVQLLGKQYLHFCELQVYSYGKQ